MHQKSKVESSNLCLSLSGRTNKSFIIYLPSFNHEGDAITILQRKEVFHFKKMHQSLGTNNPIQKFNMTEKVFSEYGHEYEAALEQLKVKVRSEKKKL